VTLSKKERLKNLKKAKHRKTPNCWKEKSKTERKDNQFWSVRCFTKEKNGVEPGKLITLKGKKGTDTGGSPKKKVIKVKPPEAVENKQVN